ncbi:putative bifunctional diguanylate cyclase/phosphodiesterase [Agaricicola taiwanensis]|uniref:putative bifunctional diguanylate cyclase/phosphodiesterase n=1 Tax=Agaricicola taiwanensis TaxID=591372 RepID=UPI00166520A1|nr:GGDEF domain-containing phosphodiesterase [Agaricicola taiwanensis]
MTRAFLDRLAVGQISLTAQCTALIAAVAVALISLMLVMQSLDGQRASREMVERRVDLMVSSIETIVSDADHSEAREQIAAVLDRLDFDGLVVEQEYVSFTEEASSSVNSPKQLILARLRQDQQTVVRRFGDQVALAVPVPGNGGPVAAYYFALSTAPLEASPFGSLPHKAMMLAILLLVIVPLAVAAMLNITSPLRKLVSAARGADQDRTTLELIGRRTDEIGDLSRAFQDLQDRMDSAARTVEKLTTTDVLTGLPNTQGLRRQMTRHLESGIHFALFIVNVERLSQLNVELGGDMGEKVIAASAERLSEALASFQPMVERSPVAFGAPQDRFIARLGGDEFAILIPGTEIGEEAAEVATQLLMAFHNPLDINGRSVVVTVSAGIALAPADGADHSAMKRNAHLALHEARSQGSGHFCFARSDLAARADRRLAIEQELRLALERNELVVFYQPQVDLRDGAFIGAEALVRWIHPSRGLVGPMEFIDVAEDVGLIDQLGSYVLQSVAAQLAAWGRKGLYPKVAVNVSASQCMQPDFCSGIFDVLSKSGVPTTSLQIELTESVAMRDPVRTARELAPLRAAGVRLAIDDFGTGYSNLATITRLPFDVLKIDRSFVSECVRDGASRVVVATILSMAQNLGYQTVAEGVETELQREFLLRYGCTFAQGYLFGKPMPAPEFEAAFIEQRRIDARDLQEQVRSVV